MTLDITVEDRDQERHITAYLRRPSDEEQRAFRRLSMTAIAGVDGDKTKQAEMGLQFHDQIGAMAKAMVYGVEGEMPSWANDCDNVHDFVTRYCTAEIAGAALAMIQRAMGGMIEREKVEQEQTKN